MTKTQLAERDEARDKLRAIFKPGDTVYTILRHVSRSGMSRRISVVAADAEASGPRDVSWLVARACGIRLKDGALVVGGCGMDMGYHVMYELASALYRGAFTCTGEDCPSNDHTNGDRNYEPHEHSDGGYALRHAWL